MKKMISSLLNKLKGAHKNTPSMPDLSEQDVMLISYPRSGNTWVRFLLANILKPAGVEIDFHNVHQYLPELKRNNDIIESLESPRIIKTHALYDDTFPRVIYLVRDGRDVYASYYYYRLKQLEEGTTFSEFLRKKDHFPSSWNDHIQSWLGADMPEQDLLVVRYEDLLKQPELEIRKMVDFIGIESSDQAIRQAVEDSRFEKMKKIDQTKGRKYNLTGTKNFVRKGKAGSWQEEFSPEDIEYFKETAGETLIWMGYEKNLDW